MKITQLKQQIKDTSRVSIFLDDSYAFSLTLDQILEQKLKKGLELDALQVEVLKKLSDEGKLRVKALEWLMLRPHSVKEFREYCFRKRIEGELCEKWTQEFEDRRYLDDEKFAVWFSEQRLRKGKSLRAVQAELAQKGIQQGVSQRVLAERANDEDSLVNLVKKMRTRPRCRDDKKLTAYLIGKGFRYSDVLDALKADEF